MSSDASGGRSVLKLQEGLEVWQVTVDDLHEQDKNARAMDPAAFERLEATIKRDGRLEALPFCALTDRGIEIVSGHHRVRASRAGNVRNLFVLVDTTGLTPDQIKAKQLAHNAIQGRDDVQLLREIYESIEDTDARLESFIDPESLDLNLESLAAGNVNVDFDSRVVSIVFLPHEEERFKRAVEQVSERLRDDADTIYVSDLERVEAFQELAATVTDAIEIRSFGAVFGTVADIVLKQLGADEPDDDETERVHLSEVVKRAYIPREAADIIAKALDRMESDGHIGDANRWQGLEYLAADYLAGGRVGTGA